MPKLQPRIRIYWSKREQDLMGYADKGASKSTIRYLFGYAFPKEVLKELDERGYDVSTLRFQIRRKPPGVLDQLAEIE